MPRAFNEGFYIDTTELRDFTRKLRIEAPEANRKMRRELREAAKLLQVEAKAKLGGHYPSAVPTVKVHVSFASAYVSTGTKKVPLGGLLEAGNTGRGQHLDDLARVEGGEFWHWSFGNKEAGKFWQPYTGDRMGDLGGR